MEQVSTRYITLGKQLDAILDKDLPYISSLANFSALLWLELSDINWVGCYLTNQNKDTLFLGPFQGKPACTSITVGKGVCGEAFAQQETLRVADVHSFPGHIACDSASESEIVVPFRLNGQLFGVIDIDSPKLSRFGADDQIGIEHLVNVLENNLADVHF
ncbi:MULTISPECIES: GAF domain-containing protein [unclassified Agarivorans]|uniref:GAF domain-containing protein n=1 Tax=unclassified Agarivorans TaxID=2636026 RepID=UPI0026E38DF7|nr:MULTISPECIES: GAF domain-containing protein [unclassified Agarivorans]MDO6685993.1 GAF domain-containing protein [Agarivorans sp. 3_MG-2023]MDO6713869.1 GAF domain-containing protein [Agarivorans sp. 2_MG-2023]